MTAYPLTHVRQPDGTYVPVALHQVGPNHWMWTNPNHEAKPQPKPKPAPKPKPRPKPEDVGA